MPLNTVDDKELRWLGWVWYAPAVGSSLQIRVVIERSRDIVRVECINEVDGELSHLLRLTNRDCRRWLFPAFRFSLPIGFWGKSQQRRRTIIEILTLTERVKQGVDVTRKSLTFGRGEWVFLPIVGVQRKGRGEQRRKSSKAKLIVRRCGWLSVVRQITIHIQFELCLIGARVAHLFQEIEEFGSIGVAWAGANRRVRIVLWTRNCWPGRREVAGSIDFPRSQAANRAGPIAILAAIRTDGRESFPNGSGRTTGHQIGWHQFRQPRLRVREPSV